MTKLLATIGLCRKAGKLISGFDAAVKELEAPRSKVCGILLASDVSEKTQKECRFYAEKHKKPVTVINADMAQLESVLGKKAGVLAITDAGLYASITKNNNIEGDI